MSRYRNTTSQPLVFDTAGHLIDAFGVAEVNPGDRRSARLIQARRLVLVPDPVEFIEPVVPEPATEPAPEPTPEPATEPEQADAPEPAPESTSRKSRTRTTQKEE